MKLISTISLLGILTFNANANMCDKINTSLKSAKLIYDQLQDADNAYLILDKFNYTMLNTNNAYRSSSCITADLRQKYINDYIKYITNGNFNLYQKENKLNYLAKKFPQNITIQKYLGDIYKKRYSINATHALREKTLQQYKKYIKLAKAKNLPIDKDILKYVQNNGLKKVSTTWGDYLITNPNDIPTGKFKAFYFDSRKPKQIIFSEIVENIGVNYPYEEFHNIDSGHFGGYWVGYLDINKEEPYTFAISFSNSKIRVIVDGYELYNGSHRAMIPYTFSKGKHKIEIEYLNGWHTTELTVDILPKIKFVGLDDIKKTLLALDMKNIEFWYAGVYDSKAKDNTITLDIQKSDKPIVLLLQSYSAIRWKINNPYHTDIKKVILNSYAPISTVSGITPDKVIYTKSYTASGYILENRCSCMNGIFHCSSGTFDGYSPITSMFDKQIKGFSGKYSTDLLQVPEKIMDKAEYDKLKQQKEKIELLRKECMKNKQINIGNLFK